MAAEHKACGITIVAGGLVGRHCSAVAAVEGMMVACCQLKSCILRDCGIVVAVGLATKGNN